MPTLLVINPGSTSDEIALFNGKDKVFHKVVRYSPKELEPYEGKKITEQYELRYKQVITALTENNVKLETIDAFVGRGGLLKPIPSGTYRVNERMIEDLKASPLGDHPSNLGGLIAYELAQKHQKPAFIADPVVVDELCSLARYSGMPENPRISIFHALNQKRVARLTAEKIGKRYEDCNFIVAHMGGGGSVGAHQNGKVIDVNNALDGDGAFTPQRSGGVPAGGLVKMCFSGQYTLQDIKLKLKGKGGVYAYTGTSDIVLLRKFIKGEPLTEQERANLKPDLSPEKAREVIDALVYQVAKEIGAMAAVLSGKVDAIIFTGGLAYESEMIVEPLRKRVEWIAPLYVYPGGDEMAALAEAALRVLSGEEQAKEYA